MWRPLANATQHWTGQSTLILWSIGLACVLATLFVIDPARTTLFPPCPFRALTGYYCAGCGSLRATHQLLNGHVASALCLNPLMVLSLPFLGYALVSARWKGLQVPWMQRFARHPLWPQAILILLVLYWALRNLPFAPFSWLAP